MNGSWTCATCARPADLLWPCEPWGSLSFPVGDARPRGRPSQPQDSHIRKPAEQIDCQTVVDTDELRLNREPSASIPTVAASSRPPRAPGRSPAHRRISPDASAAPARSRSRSRPALRRSGQARDPTPSRPTRRPGLRAETSKPRRTQPRDCGPSRSAPGRYPTRTPSRSPAKKNDARCRASTRASRAASSWAPAPDDAPPTQLQSDPLSATPRRVDRHPVPPEH